MDIKYKEEIKNTKTQNQNSGDGNCRDFRKNKDNKDNMDNKDSKYNKGHKEGSGNGVVLACRCMEISERAVREAIRQGATTVDAVKRATMVGMGLCQSKTCFNIIARLISGETGSPVSHR